eukprot:765962-Hanusia_phi.AAC.5
MPVSRPLTFLTLLLSRCHALEAQQRLSFLRDLKSHCGQASSSEVPGRSVTVCRLRSSCWHCLGPVRAPAQQKISRSLASREPRR